ncbi:MAG TPA: TIGR00730 family Rossman fold protein, partial [Paraburkholderia sp.]|nr:TIGR00730 family Rossman fold protein [Paraburkholderia sp.]
RLAQEQIITRDMHERKRTMFERADAFVALPGGLGTLEEIVEQMTWAQLGRHKKPILMANVNGFWDPLLALIDHMRALGLVPPPARGVNYLVVDRVEDILPKLREAARAVSEAEKQMAVPAERL